MTGLRAIQTIHRSALAALLMASLLAGSPVRAETTLERAMASKTVTIGIHNRSPWGWRDKDGAVVGYEPDLIRAALAPMGIDKIEFVIADFGAQIPGLLAGRFDMSTAGIAITPPRCAQVAFAEPDLSSGDGVLVASGNPLKLHGFDDIVANPNVRLGGGRGSENAKHAIAAGVPSKQMMLFPDVDSELAALIAGRVDAIVLSAVSIVSILSDPNVKGIERAQPFRLLANPDGTPVALYTAVAFRPDDASLRDAYNAQLAKLKADGTLKRIMTKYGFSDAEDPPMRTAADLCAKR